MRDSDSIFGYLVGSMTKNWKNMTKAGSNNELWGTVGTAIVGAVIGSVYPGLGTIIGFFVGGLLGSTINYARS